MLLRYYFSLMHCFWSQMLVNKFVMNCHFASVGISEKAIYVERMNNHVAVYTKNMCVYKTWFSVSHFYQYSTNYKSLP
jgi:hypothetical protein